MNLLTAIDGYKLDHRRQYGPGITKVYSNWTARASRIPDTDHAVFFGLQYFLDKYMTDAYDDLASLAEDGHDARAYERLVNSYLGPNQIGKKHVQDLLDLGHMPLEFKALPEGTKVPLRCPMFTVENTHPDFFWLTNYIETLLSNILWLPCTSATTAGNLRKAMNKYAAKTGTDPGFVQWQGHDFSFRGMPGYEAAALSGAGHLLYFTGTDTIPAIELIKAHYTPETGAIIGGSVAATEHSVMCAGGYENEQDTFDRLLELYPTGIVSVVSDTWDLWNVLTKILPALKDKIMAREGKLVIRPDSGDPVEIICGTDYHVPGSPQAKGVIELLWDTFGGTVTSTGHKMLDQHIGCIYGDSINQDRAEQIMRRLEKKGFASGNIVFGIGSYNYQYVTRDTLGFAMKATWVEKDGKGMDIYKCPVTDDGTKNSAKGRLAVFRSDSGRLYPVNQATPEQEAKSLLQTVWKDGKFRRWLTFEQVRTNASAE